MFCLFERMRESEGHMSGTSTVALTDTKTALDLIAAAREEQYVIVVLGLLEL